LILGKHFKRRNNKSGIFILTRTRTLFSAWFPGTKEFQNILCKNTYIGKDCLAKLGSANQ